MSPDPATPVRSPASETDSFPDFVVIGGQKTGSTFVMVQLAEHPQVFMPSQEVAFFEDPEYEAGIDSLKAQFSAARSDQVLGFKRPNLLGIDTAPERMHRHMPQGRMIAILRDPVERAVSAYFHLMKHGLIPLRPIEVGLRAILDGSIDARWPAATRIITWGLYHHHLQRFLEYFDRSQLLVLLYDDIRGDPTGTLRRAYEFIGVDQAYVPPDIERRPMPGVYNMTYQRILRLVRPLRSRLSEDRLRVMPHEGFVGTLSRLAFWPLERWVLERTLAAPRPRLSPELHRRVAEQFVEDVERLEAWLGVDLSAWASRRSVREEVSASR